MWTEIPAKEFCASVRDGTHDSPKPVESGRFLITSRHIIGGQIDLSNAYLISIDDFEAINKRSKVDRWDVLISMIGTVGEPCLVREEPEFAIKNIGLFKTKGELDGKWLYYYLTSPQAQALIRQSSRGTTQAYVPLGALRDFPVRVPRDREVMRAITNVLGGLDEKINLNRRINQTIEAMAQAIFKSWFVDFDPVKARIAAIQEGRDPRRAAMSAISGKPDAELDALPPEQYDQLAATAALFPDELEESELGEIPRGWICGALGDICSFTAGSAFKPEHQGSTEGDYPFIKVSDMNLAGNEVFIQSANNYVSRAQQSEMKAKLHPLGATVFAKIGVALISNRRRLLTTPTIIDNNLMSASPIEGKSGKYFLYSMLSTIDFNTLASGTALPYINVSDLKKVAIIRPPSDVWRTFEAKASSIFSMMQALTAQSLTLATTRNTLLPKLLSGEVEVFGKSES
ncbi:restriction endonuclease subunit S [Pseudomonas sp. MAP12]|uniref:Restriction endonuclease subunit S n=1 Tax=Geopseudomonas aromaticivorans TaxID=2849492 RepID=A0ABS6N0K7_9GAMM|nr:restriction endonuclease subunit S [Pseudomonas aromaticivorans]MBV2134072.1 restriction endonuclease subunit S [Pseudomonas aromaticivorans]